MIQGIKHNSSTTPGKACPLNKHGERENVIFNQTKKGEQNYPSGVPQWSVLGLIIFNMFVNDMCEDLVGNVCLFASDPKVCNTVNLPECAIFEKIVKMYTAVQCL